MILMPDMEMLTQILCLCLPCDRAAAAIPWREKKQKHYSIEGKQMYIHQSST